MLLYSFEFVLILTFVGLVAFYCPGLGFICFDLGFGFILWFFRAVWVSGLFDLRFWFGLVIRFGLVAEMCVLEWCFAFRL